MQPHETSQTSPGGSVPTWGFGLPPRLVALIDPRVLAECATAVDARINNAAGDRVRRMRAAEIVADHILKGVNNV